jgi:hypothetical protein
MGELYVTGTHVELSRITVRRTLMIALALTVTACRGEKVPRDYQNEPPAMTHPPTTSSQTPTAKGLPNAAPQPDKGVTGQTTKAVNPASPPPPKLKDQAPATTTKP